MLQLSLNERTDNGQEHFVEIGEARVQLRLALAILLFFSHHLECETEFSIGVEHRLGHEDIRTYVCRGVLEFLELWVGHVFINSIDDIERLSIKHTFLQLQLDLLQLPIADQVWSHDEDAH